MWRWLIGLAFAQGLLYATIARLSRGFVFGEDFQQRPILAVIGLFVACFVLYTASMFVALRVQSAPRLGWLIVLSSVGFRVILLFSQPIQEIDIYRYLWDGAVAVRGVNPFHYAPAEVLASEPSEQLDNQVSPSDLTQLVRLRDTSPAIAEILRRIHFPDLTTVYPPVSQAVFALAASLTPSDASVGAHVTIMKAVLLIFDLATIILVWLMLLAMGRHPAWVIAYAWCPLVMKEFANSGHLDSIAVCLTTAAVYCAARQFTIDSRTSNWWRSSAAVLLGLAVGAKLYPVVLLPLMTVATGRRSGAKGFIGFAGTSLAVSCVCLTPMFWPFATAPVALVRTAAPNVQFPARPLDIGPSSVGSNEGVAPPESRSGLTAFLSRWEMNDFLFLVVVENLRPRDAKPDQPQAWFAIVPDSWRKNMLTRITVASSIEVNRAPFLLARVVTTTAYLGVAAWLLYGVFRKNSATAFLEAAFLTLAWFWLLSPTQNPWYWTWALPLLPFARGRAWFAVSGLVLTYYLRFWLLYHWPKQHVWGTPYDGSYFFDFVVTWIEFGPWFLWLVIESADRTRRAATHPTPENPKSVDEFTEQPLPRA